MIEREHDGYWVEMSGDPPVDYGRDVRQKPLRPDTSEPAHSRLDSLPMTRMVDPQAESDLLVRINQLEAVTKDLFAKLKALEERLF